MDRPDWAPPSIDLDRPNSARVYDFMLGGSHNFAVDRLAARHALAVMPDAAVQAHVNRAFLRRAVAFLLSRGVRQFLDIGSGIPTVGNVHAVAQAFDPSARVVYVDIEPVAVQHSKAILAGNDRTAVIQQDARQPEAILTHPDARRLLDFNDPIGVLLVALLHYIDDDADPYRIVSQLRDGVAPGSHVVISHISDESRPGQWSQLTELSRRSGTSLAPRRRAQVERFFDGMDLVEPGVVWAPVWRPESPADVPQEPELSNNLVGVGRKP